MKRDYKFLAALITATAVFVTAGSAASRHSKSKSKSKSEPLARLPAGVAWADTNKDGQLSNEEFQRAKHILEEKLKKTESNSARAASATTAKKPAR